MRQPRAWRIVVAVVVLGWATVAHLPPVHASEAPTAPAPALVSLAPTRPLAGQAFSAQAGDTVSYVIQRGDTLYSIAKTYGVTVEQLQQWNGITDPRRLRVGQTLTIRPAAGGDTVRAQDVPPADEPVGIEAAPSSTILTFVMFGVFFLLLIAILSLFDRRKT